MKSSYSTEDVTLLLKDISGLVEPLPTKEREIQIQSGTHYCEMLPLEYKPSPKYMQAYEQALSNYAKKTADSVCQCAENIYAAKGRDVVLVSLARAGIPIGILIKWYLSGKYHINVPHFAVSIIRGRGIDHNAMQYLVDSYPPYTIQFIDGWTGKGAITTELKKALQAYPGITDELAVLSDPANSTRLCGTHDDFLIPSSCLNCTISGLISRTFLRSDIIKENDFHGAVYYGDLEKDDLSYSFLLKIKQNFDYTTIPRILPLQRPGIKEVREIADYFNIADVNFVKPGIGETTRVLLRRVPWKILIRKEDKDAPELKHLLQLADEKNVPVEAYPLKNYKTCGIIKQFSDL